MKLHIKMLTGKTADIDLDQNTTIGELRSKVARAVLSSKTPEELQSSIGAIGYINLVDSSGNKVTVYRDDPNDLDLIAFIHASKPNFDIVNMTAFLKMNLGPYNYRPTKYNSSGVATYALTQEEKQTTFFKSTINLNTHKSFVERLEQIGFSGNVPDNFLDPITAKLMNNPMLADDTKTYDAETIKKLNNISPFTRTAFKTIEPNLLLRSQIEDFVSSQERRALSHQLKH